MTGLYLDRERLRRTLVGRELPAQARCAAVSAVLLESDAELKLLVIRRAERLGDPWSGHMALPGGHWDPSDRDLFHTAVRETQEEVGLHLSHIHLLGKLDDLAPVRRGSLLVRPYVFVIDHVPTFQLSEEVSMSFWAPLAPLALGHADTEYEVSLAQGRAKFPGFKLGEHVIWGITYQIVRSLLSQLTLPPPLAHDGALRS